MQLLALMANPCANLQMIARCPQASVKVRASQDNVAGVKLPRFESVKVRQAAVCCSVCRGAGVCAGLLVCCMGMASNACSCASGRRVGSPQPHRLCCRCLLLSTYVQEGGGTADSKLGLIGLGSGGKQIQECRWVLPARSAGLLRRGMLLPACLHACMHGGPTLLPDCLHGGRARSDELRSFEQTGRWIKRPAAHT